MKIEEFNKTYKEKGGLPKLNEFRAMLMTLKFISEHFGVSNERVRQWFQEFYHETYDPRMNRKEKIIQSMIDFAKNNTEDNFRQAFKFHNEEYFIYALTECYQRSIYKHINEVKNNAKEAIQ